MIAVGSTISTEAAEMILIADRVVAQYIHPAARFGTASCARIRKAREKLSAGLGSALMLVFPQEFIVDAQLANEDHFRKESTERSILALAVVAQNATVCAVSKFYFRYYPQAFEVRVFDTEDVAKEWLMEQVSSPPEH